MTRKVLDVGAGPMGNSAQRIRDGVFRGWQVVRLDIDASVRPDVVGSVTQLKRLVREAEFDAVWSSHNIEHLADHEVRIALEAKFHALKRDGLAIITTPDIHEVAQLILTRGLEHAAYTSPAGPITPLDMLYGHGRSIAEGQRHMAHRTGFTQERLDRCLLEAGFTEVWTAKGKGFDLWAVALMPRADTNQIRGWLASTALGFLAR